MSELQLSQDLIRAVQDAVVSRDPAAQDAGVTSQYLAAIIGVLLGTQDIPKASKKEILEELYAFSDHVMEDVAQPPQASPPPPQDAFGIWRPGDQ